MDLSDQQKTAIVKAAVNWWREEWGCAKAVSINEARKRRDDDPLDDAEAALIASMDHMQIHDVLRILDR